LSCNVIDDVLNCKNTSFSRNGKMIFSLHITLVVALALKERRITGKGGAQRNPCERRDTIKKSRGADGKTMYGIGLTVRHTPAFVFVHRFAIGTATGSSFSPLREGMGCRITLIVND
jgi:hypothetical protein